MNLAHSVLASHFSFLLASGDYAAAFKGMLFVEGVNQVGGEGESMGKNATGIGGRRGSEEYGHLGR